MAKNIKLNIKNTQIAQAVNLGAIKGKLAKKKAPEEPVQPHGEVLEKKETGEEKKEEAPKIKARSRSAFAESHAAPHAEIPQAVHEPEAEEPALQPEEPVLEPEPVKKVEGPSPEELRAKLSKSLEQVESAEEKPPVKAAFSPVTRPVQRTELRPSISRFNPKDLPPPKERLGPTGRHVKDLMPPPSPIRQSTPARTERTTFPRRGPPGAPPRRPGAPSPGDTSADKTKPRTAETPSTEAKKPAKTAGGRVREFRDLKPTKKPEGSRHFDARDRQGLRGDDEGASWRKKRSKGHKVINEEITVRPTSLKVRVPISIKDLAEKMKLKGSQLISKLFLQGVMVTLNDTIEDETTIQLLGHEFGCDISIDTTEEERIRITDKSIREEISEASPEKLKLRPPIVAFMGHVDHGKTSLIDSIRSSNRVAGEAGAITQHIGAFKCHTAVGDITVLDTPGHEAFSAMRARGADVTDIVVLVVAGDEGIKPQTVEAIEHAKAAKVTIVVAINKCDKPTFNAENVYRQLSEHELLPESWGGTTLTVNCSAVTGEGIPQLLETLALQAEVLELKAEPEKRARGAVIESELHKGMGVVATILVQNGTLKLGDSLVFGTHFGKVKTMRDEHGAMLQEASPSTPVAITGLSGLPSAGEDFIVVKNEKEAREISEVRATGVKQSAFQGKKKMSMDSLLQKASEVNKKVLNVLLRADVQGSLEALKTALMKIESSKVEVNIIFSGVGEISESDVQLASASKAVILGFHTAIEGHADQMIRQLGITVRLHDIIYHAIDDVKELMTNLLDKIPQENEKGKALVKATFSSSHHGIIAGCQVIEGSITRSSNVRLRRGNDVIWTGGITSLKRVKEDVKEVAKGLECGILLNNFNEVQPDDILEAFEITYLKQEL